ncbi:hypothetical protein [Carbonactinospora thermoautotrophica]|nr:hypothetical protein [Carbonactinospora thermoautotrophica]KWX01756.1 hypothetical protein LI90_2788 [Carbonactinospora thermoautotrophica]
MPSLEEIQRTVAEVEQRVAEARRQAAARADQRITEQIRDGLGVVVVDGHASLVAIEFEPESLRKTDERRLAQATLEAIRRAEQRAGRDDSPMGDPR